MAKRKLTIPEQHELRVAQDTLKMNPVMAAVMGGPTHEQARETIKRLTGEEVRDGR
jgi:hypothetical protein